METKTLAEDYFELWGTTDDARLGLAAFGERGPDPCGRAARRATTSVRIVIDASHGNSGKDHVRQAAVARELAERIAAGEPGVVGVMLESFLEAGRQDVGGEAA